MEIRRRLNRIAASQHSLITFDQALKAGLTTGQVRQKGRSGEWLLSRPRVYAVAGAPATWAKAVAATVFSLQPGAWVSHHSAAKLWAFLGVEAEHVDVVVDFERRVRMAGVVGHRTRALFTADHPPSTDSGHHA